MTTPARTALGRPRVLIILAGLTLLCVLAGAAGALAAGRFADDIASVHQPGVSFVAEAGITTGCRDGSVYCPSDAVTRDQMATFMHRLAGKAPGVAPSVNAATVDGFTADELRGQDGQDGQDAPTGFLPIAFGRINANGNASHGTGNFTSNWDSTFSN